MKITSVTIWCLPNSPDIDVNHSQKDLGGRLSYVTRLWRCILPNSGLHYKRTQKENPSFLPLVYMKTNKFHCTADLQLLSQTYSCPAGISSALKGSNALVLFNRTNGSKLSLQRLLGWRSVVQRTDENMHKTPELLQKENVQSKKCLNRAFKDYIEGILGYWIEH